MHAGYYRYVGGREKDAKADGGRDQAKALAHSFLEAPSLKSKVHHGLVGSDGLKHDIMTHEKNAAAGVFSTAGARGWMRARKDAADLAVRIQTCCTELCAEGLLTPTDDPREKSKRKGPKAQWYKTADWASVS